MWKYYSVALCSNTQGQQNFMHVGCTAADELPIESIWGRIRTNLLPSLMGAPCCYQIGGRRWWDWCPPWREVRTSMRLASRRQRFNEIRSRMMKCGSLTYHCIHKMWLRRLMTVACRIRESWWNLLYPQGDGWWRWKLNETQVDYPLFIYLAPLVFYGPAEVFMVAIIIYALLLSSFDCGGGY